MKAIYRQQLVQCWEISKDATQPDWVIEAFKKNALTWLDDRLRILMPALYPKWAKNSHYYGYGIYTFGNIGDIPDLTNGKVITKQYFNKHYQVITD